MSGLELNKIAAAILLASLIAMFVGVVSNVLYKPTLEVAKRGHQIEVADAAENSGPVVEEVIDIEALMASANADAGEKIVKKCIACHSFDKGGANKVGPNLHNIVGAPKAHAANFPYSKAMAAAGGVWDTASLFAFIKKPSKYMPGTKMAFAGISNPQDIAHVIAYLKKQS